MTEDAHQQTSWGDLPDGVLERILKFLRLGDSWDSDALSLLCVNKNWRRCVELSVRSVQSIPLSMPFAQRLAPLTRFKCLRRLVLSLLTDSVIPFAAFEAFVCLESLELRNLNLEEDASNSLSVLQNLREVFITKCTLNSALVRSLATLTKLRTLGLKDIRILEEGMVDLSQVLPHQLVDLKIVKSPQLTGGSVKKFTMLRELTLHLPFLEEDFGLGACIGLKMLKLSGEEFDGEGLKYVSSLVNLEFLQVGLCFNLTGHHLQYLKSLKKLSEISICGCTLMNDAYEQLANLKQIKHLSFYFCPAMRVGQLQSMSHLQSLQFGYCPMIEADWESLLALPFVSGLNHIGFKFSGKIPKATLQAFCDREPAISVNLDIPLPE